MTRLLSAPLSSAFPASVLPVSFTRYITQDGPLPVSWTSFHGCKNSSRGSKELIFGDLVFLAHLFLLDGETFSRNPPADFPFYVIGQNHITYPPAPYTTAGKEFRADMVGLEPNTASYPFPVGQELRVPFTFLSGWKNQKNIV